MTTVINTPSGGGSDSGNGMGAIIAVLLILFFGFLFVVYGLPMLNRSTSSQVDVNVPDKVQVDVNQPETSQ